MTHRSIRSAGALAPLLLALQACSTPPAPPPACEGVTVPEHPLEGTTDLTFDLGPYLMDVRGDGAVVMWRTLEACDGKVDYGSSAEALPLSATHAGAARVHEVRLSGLQPGARVFYRATSCGTASAVHSFHAAPPAGTPTRFTVFSDTQSHPEISSRIVRGMLAQAPHFVLHAGDTVSDGSEAEQFKTQIFDPWRPLGHQVPLYVALGNHEANAQTFYDLVSYPRSVPEDPRSESTYSFTFGNVFVLVVYSWTAYFDIVVGGESVTTPLSRAIRAAAESEAARAATWRVAIAHAPAVSESWGPSCDFDGEGSARNWLLPLLRDNGFDAYFAGHTHLYERGLVDGVVHVVAGGGGGDLDVKCRELDEVTVWKRAHHFVRVDAGCDELRLRAYALGEDEPFDTAVVKADARGRVSEESTRP